MWRSEQAQEMLEFTTQTSSLAECQATSLLGIVETKQPTQLNNYRGIGIIQTHLTVKTISSVEYITILLHL